MTTVLVLNGPNLGRLGRREPEVYGSTTHDDLVEMIEAEAAELGLSAVVRQSFPAANLVDRAFSMSRTAPAAIGAEKAAALAADLTAFAGRVAVDGQIAEILQANALIARRL